MGPLVDVHGLRITFPDATFGTRVALDGVSFELGEHDSMALVGESGCGKTLSALSLLRLEPAEARVCATRLQVAGTNLLEASERELIALRGGVVGLVLQDPAQALNPVRTVGMQVAEAARLHLGVSAEKALRLAADLLAEVGVEPPEAMLAAYPHQLSGGQRQRVLIACALSGAPRALVADEPTSALDTVTARRLVATLAKLKNTRGLAMMVISHDLPLIAAAVEWVTVLYAGETVEIGRREDIFARPAHPYTAALVDTMPRGVNGRRGPLPTIPGQVARPAQLRAGCRFAPRCPHAFSRCQEARPALVPTDRGRWVRCFLTSSAEHRDDA